MGRRVSPIWLLALALACTLPITAEATPEACFGPTELAGRAAPLDGIADSAVRLECAIDPDGVEQVQLFIDGAAPMVLRGVDGESLRREDVEFDPASLSVRRLAGEPPLLAMEYDHSRLEAGGVWVDYRRHRIIPVDDPSDSLLDRWTSVSNTNRGGFFTSAVADVRIDYQDSTLTVVEVQFRGDGFVDDLHESGEEGYRAPWQTGVLQASTRQIDSRTGEIRSLQELWASSEHLRVVDDGAAGWLLVGEGALGLVAWEPGEMIPRERLPDPQALAGLPAKTRCWLYNRRPWQPADGDHPHPPAQSGALRPSHFVPSACCAVENAASGHFTGIYESPSQDEREPPGRLLALLDRAEGQCWSANLAQDGPLGRAPYDRLGNPVFSPDGRRLGYRAQRGEARFVVVDAQSGPPWHRVSAPVFSPDSRHVAYWARDPGKEFIVHDREPGPRTEGVGLPVFSPGGKLAYRVSDGSRWRVMVDGTAGPSFDAIGTFSINPSGRANDLADLVFSTQGTLAYAARRGDDWHLVRDHISGEPYQHVGLPVFSPDGGRLAFRARRNDREFVVLDDEPGPAFEFVGNPVFSPDGARIAYWASEADTEFVMHGERRGPAIAAPGRVGAPVFDHAGTAPVYRVRDVPEANTGAVTSERVMRGAEAVAAIDGAQGVVLNRLTGELAWWEQDGAIARVVLAGHRAREGWTEGDLGPRHALVFSPDGRRLAHGAGGDGREVIRIGDGEGPAFDEVGDPVFSPSGDRIAYRARLGEVWLPIVEPVAGATPPAGVAAVAADAIRPATPVTVALTDVVPRRLPHPVAVVGDAVRGGLIIGGSAARRWYGTGAIDEGHVSRALTSRDECTPVGPDWIESDLRWRLYAFDRKLGECPSANVSACFGGASGEALVRLTFAHCAVEGYRVAVAAPWNALPRRPRVVRETPHFAHAVRRVLDAHGRAAAPVRIVAVHAVDLDGDGREEHVINAAHGSDEGETAATTDYSLLLLVSTGGDRQAEIISAWWGETDASPAEEYDPYYADANGDGVMEIFVDWRYYEGDGTRVFQLNDGRVKETPLAWFNGA